MRCPDCNIRNSVAASKCKSCGRKFARKPVSRRMKIGLAAAIIGVLTWGAASAIIPAMTDPEQSLQRIAKRAADGPKNAEDAKKISEEFDRAMQGYLSRIGQLPTAQLIAKLQKALPSNFFEVHVMDLPRGLRIVEVDTVLQARDYLIMKTGSGSKQFALSGLEVFDDARIINESAGPMLVVLGHTGGQPPHRPQVKVYGLLPDDITDETDKLLPAIRGEGAARFAKNGRDIMLDLSLLSLGQSEKLFARVSQHEDGTAHQHLEWKDAHYVSRYDYGTSPFTALYAVARCMRYPDLTATHSRFLGPAGEQLVRENKSPEAGDFEVKRLSASGDKITYKFTGSPGSFVVEVGKNGGLWSIASARSASPATAAEPANQAKTIAAAPVIERKPPEKQAEPAPKPVQAAADTRATKSVLPAARNAERTRKVEPVSKPEPARKPEPAKVTREGKQQGQQRTAVTEKSPVTAKPPEPVETAPVAIGGDRAEISRQISAGTVNLRSGPNTSAKPVAELSKGAQLEVLSRQGGWYRVRYQGKEGYVYGGLVDYKKPEAYTTATITKSKTVLDSQHKPVATPQTGDRLVILGGIENNKYKVQLSNGKIGYVDKDAVDVSIEAPPLVP